MTGGTVIEVADVKGRPGVLFIDVSLDNETSGLFVAKNAKSQRIEIGDEIWWKGNTVYWTPAESHKGKKKKKQLKEGIEFDIAIPRVGKTDVCYPDRPTGG